MQDNYLKLKRLTEFSNTQFMNELENNVTYFLNSALLKAGAFFNVVRPTAGIQGIWHRLSIANDGNLAKGRVWQGARKDWVWETAIDYVRQPIIPRVFVNNVEYARNDAQYGHYINHPLGQVVFNTALPNNAVVEAQYSFRNVQIYKENDARWWRELHFRSFESGQSQFTQSDKGDWSIGTFHRIQLPTIIVEALSNSYSRPYEIGAHSIYRFQSVRFRIVAETSYERNQLADILLNQYDKVIKLFDTDLVARAGVAPLNEKGDINSTGLTYDQLVIAHPAPLANVIWRDPVGQEMDSPHPNLYEATVNITFEVVIP